MLLSQIISFYILYLQQIEVAMVIYTVFILLVLYLVKLDKTLVSLEYVITK